MNILYLPAWYPSTFFAEQAECYRINGILKMLIGERRSIGKRKALSLFLCGRMHDERTNNADGSIKISYYFVNHLPNAMERKQYDAIASRLGSYILSMFGGHKPDYIHIQSLSDTAYFVVRWAKKQGIRIVLTEHILREHIVRDKFSILRDSVYNEVEHVFCVSQYLYRNLLTSNLNPRSVSVIGNLIDDRYIPSVMPKKNGRVLFVANHIADKDIDTLLLCAKKLQHLGICIDIVGLSEFTLLAPRETIKQRIERLCLTNVVLLGVMDHIDLLQLYSEYSVLLSTSISETFGIAIAEAIVYGTKVVCTDSGGIHDFVTEKNGMIVGIRDVDALVFAVQSTIANPILSIEESCRLRKRYGVGNWDKNIMKVLKF